MYNLQWAWLLLLLPLPFLIRLLPRVKSNQITVIKAPFLESLLQRQTASTKQTARWLNLLPWLLLLLAAARPQWIGEPIPLPVQGRDLLLAIDISGSMEQRDMKIGGHMVNRLTAVKAVAGEFIERREGDRIGLILFGQNAYLQTPLTFDRKTVKTLLNEAAIGLAGKSTAIGDAIGLAVKKLKDSKENNRILVLLTDGQNTAGTVDPQKAAQLAKQQQVKIYTIGVGADEMVVNDFFGRKRRINPSAELDERGLKNIAQLTGGRYFRARNSQELEKIYQLLDELEPLAEDEQFYRPTKELFFWPLLAAWLTLLISIWRTRQ